MKQKIIVTGGAGFIGSHICVELSNAGYELLIIDDFSNSDPLAVNRIRELSPNPIELFECDLADETRLDAVCAEVKSFSPAGAVHLAGLKAVGESVEQPARYYSINIGAVLTLVKALEAAGARMIVFSSSATVYGEESPNPVTEQARLNPANPYGRTKYFIEEILKDIARSDARWRIANLRYFNPVGAHPSGRIGEDPNGVPNNLFPFIAQVAIGRRDKLRVFGNDYPTIDGTGVRDYIHVCDLARGHKAALEYLVERDASGAIDVNLGAGKGYSVLQAVEAFAKASGKNIPYEIAPRREGDIAEYYADPSRAASLLGWRAEKSLEDMCADHWRWQHQNPNGYKP